MANLPPEYLPKDFTPRITFKDDTTLDAKAGFNYIANEIWIWPLDSMTFSEASSLFSNQSKTDYIRVDHSASEYEEFNHYTHLKTIQENPNGSLSICLKQ